MKNENPILTEEQVELVKSIAKSTIMSHNSAWDDFCDKLGLHSKPEPQLKYPEGANLHWTGMVGYGRASHQEKPGSVTVIETANNPKKVSYENTHYLIREKNGCCHCVVEDSLSPLEPSFKNGDYKHWDGTNGTNGLSSRRYSTEQDITISKVLSNSNYFDYTITTNGVDNWDVKNESLSEISIKSSFKNGDHVCFKSNRKHVVYEMVDIDKKLLTNVVTGISTGYFGTGGFRLAEDKDWIVLDEKGVSWRAKYNDCGEIVIEYKRDIWVVPEWQSFSTGLTTSNNNFIMTRLCEALQIPIQRETP